MIKHDFDIETESTNDNPSKKPGKKSFENGLYDSFFDDLQLAGFETDSDHELDYAKNQFCHFDSRSISETKSMTSNQNFKFIDDFYDDFVIRNSLKVLDLGSCNYEAKEENLHKWHEGYNTFPSSLMSNMLLNNLSCGGSDQISLIPSKKPIILNEREGRYTGRLKFFDENKNYGFIIKDDDCSDVFAHYEDLIKGGMTKEMLRSSKAGMAIRLAFSCMSYIGKYNKSKKAVDIQLMQSTPL